MSGSGGNAFLDLLRALAPAGVPVWVLIWLAALGSIAVAAALLAVSARLSGRLERRFAGSLAEAQRSGPVLPLALAGSFGAMAAYPLAPHVFFTDLELGLVVILALLSVSAIGASLAARPAVSESSPPRAWGEAAQWLANGVPLVLALLVAVIIGGTANLIEASRLQSDWFGMGWSVFKNPFALPALAIFLAAAVSGTPRGGAQEHVRMFLLAAIAAVFFLGGFESPLTWGLRQSLGEDPGFLNTVILADGSTQRTVAIGGLVFQFVCAGTLVVKTLLGVAAMLWLRWKWPNSRFPRLIVPGGARAALGLACVLGAGFWEWLRAALWSAG